MHTSKYFKIFCGLIILFFVQSSLGCLLEESLNDLAGLAHIEHNEGGSHSHGQEQSHGHPEEKQEPKSHDHSKEFSDYCCDSSLFLLARSEKLVGQQSAKLPLHYGETIQLYDADIHLSIDTNYLIVPKSPPPRTRDSYVLSCLLHAPPIV